MLDANFWQDKENSTKTIKEKKLFEDLINSYKSSINKLKDLGDLNQLASDENNESIQKEILQEIKDLELSVKKMKLNVFYQMNWTLMIVI
jgi:peptide chain release factor 2